MLNGANIYSADNVSRLFHVGLPARQPRYAIAALALLAAVNLFFGKAESKKNERVEWKEVWLARRNCRLQPIDEIGRSWFGAHGVQAGRPQGSPLQRAMLEDAARLWQFATSLSPKVLRQFQALRLIIRADALAIEGIGPGQHTFVDETADNLAVLDNERHLAGTHLQYRAGATPAGARIAEARIEKARVMNAEFADQGIEGHHFGGVIGGHLDRFSGGQDIELVRIKNQA